MFSLEVSNSLSLAFRVIGILVVFDIWKCASLTFFSFIVFFSPVSPKLQSMVGIFEGKMGEFSIWLIQLIR